jgi:hypothetical protein
MKLVTYFFVMEDKIYRRTFDGNAPWFERMSDLHYKADQIIEITYTGRGKVIRDKLTVPEKKYFTKKEIVMLSLQAETV